MHELTIMKDILSMAVKKAEELDARKIVAIDLCVGQLRDFNEEWVQRYFDFVSTGTIAAGAKIVIQSIPVIIRCDACGSEYEYTMNLQGKSSCPKCSIGKMAIKSGTEFQFVNMTIT